MPCVKPANNHRISHLGIAAALAIGLGIGSASAAQSAGSDAPRSFLPPAPLPDAQRYEHCLQTANTDPQKAYAEAEAWRDLDGGFPAQHCAAVALIGLKKYADAATQLEALANAMMKADTGMRADALDQAGQAWLLAGKPKEAKAAFDAALDFKPKDPELLVDHAEALALAGKFSDAIDDLDVVLDQSPNRVDALVYRASAYRQLGSLDHASADIEHALRLDPNFAPGLLERGDLRRLKSDTAGAKADWEQVVKLEPGTPAAASAQENLASLTGQPSPTGQKARP